MLSMRQRPWFVWGLLTGLALSFQPADAQYTADFQTNTISGVTSNWTGPYTVGSNTFGDVLLIKNSGVLSSDSGDMGYEISSSNNAVSVAGPGSIWNANYLSVGDTSAGNSLLITDGGQVFDTFGTVSAAEGSSNNSVLVIGTASIWSNLYDLMIGSSSGNSLVVSNGGKVITSNFDIGSDYYDNTNNVVIVGAGGSIMCNYVTGDAVGGVTIAGTGTRLVVRDGGQMSNTFCYVGAGDNSSGASVLVAGPGSIWSNAWDLYVGEQGSGNSLVISNGAKVFSSSGYLGGYGDQTSNCVLISGAGSVWSTVYGLYIGGYNTIVSSLVISNGGQVVGDEGYVGYNSSSGSSARVADGALWRNDTMHVGDQGASNSLVVAGGSVLTSSMVMGSPDACDTLVELDSGSLVVTNATHDAVLEVRSGQLILTGGTLRADKLAIRNGCTSFLHTGGTLIVGELVLDPNSFRITSITRRGSDILITWLMGPGQTNALQAATGGPGGSYVTNGFADIFVVTNNPSPGTTTNYTDVGGATNSPARYYRVRLVP